MKKRKKKDLYKTYHYHHYHSCSMLGKRKRKNKKGKLEIFSTKFERKLFDIIAFSHTLKS